MANNNRSYTIPMALTGEEPLWFLLKNASQKVIVDLFEKVCQEEQIGGWSHNSSFDIADEELVDQLRLMLGVKHGQDRDGIRGWRHAMVVLGNHMDYQCIMAG